MNKMIKGSVAGATGIVLLMGGFGTYALWSDSADMEASKVTSGELDIAAGDVHWNDLSTQGTDDWDPNNSNHLVVPGDTITRTQTFAVKGTGKNLEGTVTFAPGAETNNAIGVDVDVTSDNAEVTETAAGSNNFAFDAPFSTGTMKVVVTYTLPQSTDGQVGQNVTASIAESTLTIAQTR
ncbi:MAG TPA: alternate-type signal peptide domain-containing protein [Nocardioides sp.]|uniref:alternate-type signal peptide domain-containing protein n=1 Tax=Nocardioides sp. TaxID=35761 RepID=UPI002D80A970|nr:alternate-type signal peptide domain-containing protein [Nocardioides sp.]HET6653474.1 alternate-type signal peptide domain-containing protein [Nocardioides sp.]